MAGDARGRYVLVSHVCPARFLSSGDNGDGSLWFHGKASGEWIALLAIRHSRFVSFRAQILTFRPVFALVCLDSRRSAAISPHHSARDSRAACFCADLVGIAPARAENIPTTTVEKAGPEPSEAGSDHHGLKRCSQSSKPAAGNTVSSQMMYSR